MKKNMLAIYSYALIASANNITPGIIAYMMMTYHEVDPTMVSMIMTIPAITGTLFAFLSGSVINKLGTRKVALTLEVLELLSGAIYFLFGNKTSVYALWLASALYGFLMGGNGVILGQLMKENVEDAEKRSSALGISNAVMSLGGVFFASVGGYIAAIDNGAHWQNAYLLYGVIVISLIIGILFFPKTESFISEDKPKSKAKLPLKAFLISIHYGLYFLCLYCVSLNISEYVIVTHALGTSAQAGMAVSLLTAGGILAGLGLGIYSKIFKNFTMTFLIGLAAIGFFLMVYFPNITILYVAIFLIGFSLMGTGPYIMSKLGEIVEGEAYPKALAFYSGMTNVGMLVCLYVFAFLAKIFFNDANSVDGKLFIAFVGVIILALTTIPLYAGKNSKN